MATSPFSSGRYQLAFAVALLVLAAANVKILLWLNITWQLALIDAGVTNGLLTLGLLAIVNSLRFYVPSSNRVIYLSLWCLILAVVWTAASWGLLKLFLNDNGYLNFVQSSLPIRFTIGALLFGIMAIFSVLWNELGKEKDLDLRREEAERLAREAELFKLRQQLQPHFLFNSLNSINALITVRPEEAKNMVLKLSEFLRGTLKKEDHQWVKLEEELHYLQLYLDIEKVRFGHRLLTVIQCDEEARKLELPAMLLQPLVENSIKFGLYDTIGDVTITIAGRKENQQLLIEIINPFDPETSAPQKGTGFGLTSVQRRLSLLFGRNDLLNTSAHENIFTVTVKIPQRTA